MFTCCVHMLCSHVVFTCGFHMWCSHVVFTCGVTDKDGLFEKSLASELERRPHLTGLSPKTLAPKDEPGVLFRARLRGYFTCPKLCRLWVLECFDDAIVRGEPFVKWVDPLDSSSSHDGTLVFAHFFTIAYMNKHVPEMSVRMDKYGALKSTSDCVRKIQNYIFAYRKLLCRRCNDMLKQKYAMKKHAKAAWTPLNNWIYQNSALTPMRMDRLTKFNATDQELFSVVALCLFQLSRGTNRPWGVAALKPAGYSAVAAKHKVLMTEYSDGLTGRVDMIFFYSLSIRSHTC